jgi:uncharacterized protein (TIGR02145 family)
MTAQHIMQPLFKIFKMKKNILILSVLLFNAPFIFGQVVPQGYLVNPLYQTITIGTQVWMKYNLDVTMYQNGDPIEGADIAFNRTTTTHAWCYYDHNAAFNATYGKLYNGYALNDARNVCPVGFRVPTDADFNTLATYIGGASNGYMLRQADPGLWTSPTTNSNDSYGFTALPGGYMGNANSSSNMFGFGYFWTSTPILGGGSTNYVYYLSHNYGGIRAETTFTLDGGVSVRCIHQ